MYEKGHGVAQDYKAAVRWFRLAGEQGLTEAQAKLGVMYDQGRGVAQDYKEAVRWCRAAAEQGNAPAQYNLGFMYDQGHGVAQDHKEAVKWDRLAAEQGVLHGRSIVLVSRMTKVLVSRRTTRKQ
jgi:uncharacterized protein